MTPFHGISITSESANAHKVYNIIINETELLDSFVYYKDIHALRQEATETYFRSHPYSMAASFALSASTSELHGQAAKFDGSPMIIVGMIIEPDEYGHATSHKMFSFTFTKNMDSKIDWDGFDAMAFQKIAPDFRYTSWFKQKLAEEPPT